VFRIVQQCIPVGLGDTADEVLKMNRRRTRRCEDAPGLYLKSDHGTRLLANTHKLFSNKLQLSIYGQLQIISRERVKAFQLPLFKTARIHLGGAFTFLTRLLHIPLPYHPRVVCG